MTQVRQLAAIMITDVVGYSALMGRNEARALEILDQSRNIQKPLVAEYEGSWIKELGDGVLVIFSSVLSAIECGIKIHERAQNHPGLQYKIAIHSGEIIIKDGDIIGDGVNQTARIEQLTSANSILLSGKAQSEIRNIPTIEVVELGNFTLKNIEQPVQIFAVTGQCLSIPDLSRSTLRNENNHADRETEKLISSDRRLEQDIRQIITDNLSNPDLTVLSLCKEVGYSRPQLYRKIHSITGFSPSELIREMRLLRAAELLKNNTATVSEIAYQTGFNNLSHFSKSFNERFGVTPSNYARSNKEEKTVPFSLNECIGRTRELDELIDLVQQTRLLTLTGTGGTGKTRLALELMRELVQFHKNRV